MFEVRDCDLRKLNSLTKYPSIPTYHRLDPKNGVLLEEVIPFTGSVFLTEKIDGTNARVLRLPGGMFLLGSREELLFGKGDLIGNPALGIVDALKIMAGTLASHAAADTLLVYYLEVYGGKVTAASKQYTGEQNVGFRLFDIARIDDFPALLGMSAAEIAGWRDGGGQTFLDETALQETAAQHGLEMTPRVAQQIPATDLPSTVDGMHAFLLEAISHSRATLDGGAGGRPEGLVLRTLDRSQIAKARFENYERTLKRRKT